MGLVIKGDRAKFSLTWQNKKGEMIEAEAPSKEGVQELFVWLAEYTEMKKPPEGEG